MLKSLAADRPPVAPVVVAVAPKSFTPPAVTVPNTAHLDELLAKRAKLRAAGRPVAELDTIVASVAEGIRRQVASTAKAFDLVANESAAAFAAAREPLDTFSKDLEKRLA